VDFSQQAPIGRFHVDFLIHPRLVVEAEGKVHACTQERDIARTNFLESRGYRVFRIPNYLIFSDPKGVAEMLKQQEMLSSLRALHSEIHPEKQEGVSAR
jgi:very-short-patch-repair endonuclease